MALDAAEIGRRIKQAREQRGWTQLVFAREANVSPSTVQRWEAGHLPPVRELIRIAEVLGVATEELVEPAESDQSVAETQRRLAAEVVRLSELNDRLEARLEGREHPRRGSKQAS